MKAQELRQISKDELQEKLEDLQKQLFEIKCQSVTETIENCKAAKNAKRDIARIKTILNENQ